MYDYIYLYMKIGNLTSKLFIGNSKSKRVRWKWFHQPSPRFLSNHRTFGHNSGNFISYPWILCFLANASRVPCELQFKCRSELQ